MLHATRQRWHSRLYPQPKLVLELDPRLSWPRHYNKGAQPVNHICVTFPAAEHLLILVGIYSNPVEGMRLSLSSSRTEVNSSYKHAQTDENFYIGRAGVCKLYGDTHHRERFWKRKLVCCQLKNRQTLYRSIGMINKIIWRKYYTECWSATIIILSSNVMWIYRARYHIKSRTRCCNTQKLHNSATTALLPDSA